MPPKAPPKPFIDIVDGVECTVDKSGLVNVGLNAGWDRGDRFPTKVKPAGSDIDFLVGHTDGGCGDSVRDPARSPHMRTNSRVHTIACYASALSGLHCGNSFVPFARRSPLQCR